MEELNPNQEPIQTYQPVQSQFSDEEEESGFDIMEWIHLFLHYWYLFVIAGMLALFAAYIKNRSWIESYQSTGTIMIEESKNQQIGGSQAIMQGFGVDAGFRNIDNQMIILTSNDLLGRVVDSLPFLRVDYITKGRFKTRNIYKNTPIIINPDYINPSIYGVLFKINIKKDGTYTITDEDGVLEKDLKIRGKLNMPLQNDLFYIKILPLTDITNDTELFFIFRDRQGLISDFGSRLSLNYVKEGSSVLAISLASEVPDRDIDFINKLCDVYLAENLERKNAVANKTIRFINEQLDTVSKNLNRSEGAMTSFRQDNQIVDIPTHSSDVMSKSSEYNLKAAEIKLRTDYLNYLSNYLKKNTDAGAIIAPASLGLNEPMLMSLVTEFNKALLERNAKSDQSPYYPNLNKNVENIKISITEVIKNMRASIQLEKNDLDAKLSTVKGQIRALPEKEMQMITIERKYRVDDNYYTFFLQKRAEAEIQKASNSPDNKILDKARISGVTNAGEKKKTLMTYFAIGLLIPLIILVIKELLNTTLRDIRDIEKLSPFPVVGTIRHTQSTDPLLAAHRPKSSFTEMFRVIRTRVEFVVQRKTKIALMSTSTESGDGKTYFCTNLASVYAMTGLKTLLVDMDIRKPSVNSRLEISQKLGVTNYLIGENNLEDIIVHDDKYPFDILLAGTVPPNPGELIRSEKLKSMFLELRKMYDYIIVDSSPIGLVADAYSLAPLMDTNLFIVRSRKTNKSFFKRINQQLKADKLRNFSIILNDIDVATLAYGGKYGKNYGYGYGYGYGSGYYTEGARKNKKGFLKNLQYYEDDAEL